MSEPKEPLAFSQVFFKPTATANYIRDLDEFVMKVESPDANKAASNSGRLPCAMAAILFLFSLFNNHLSSSDEIVFVIAIILAIPIPFLMGWFVKKYLRFKAYLVENCFSLKDRKEKLFIGLARAAWVFSVASVSVMCLQQLVLMNADINCSLYGCSYSKIVENFILIISIVSFVLSLYYVVFNARVVAGVVEKSAWAAFGLMLLLDFLFMMVVYHFIITMMSVFGMR
ncbi:hypothetical protein [Thaumasiovibrio subtropicus]|uniref:hypothetical protein n=1 Tax=Thaumasiovibrio subtropicus TaxID=1891207 RepID=UPI000B355343|nr:hypothetical protein [Thaumasiovibrio subtropicus]